MLFGRCALAALATDDLADKFDTFSFVGLGLAQRADLCANLSEKLLVVALENDERVFVTLALCLYLDLGG